MTSQHVDRVVPERLLLRSSECMMGVWVWHFRSKGQSHSVVCRRFLVDYWIKVNNKREVRQKWKLWFDLYQWNIDELWSVSSADRKSKWLLLKFHQEVPPVIFHHAFILQNISLNKHSNTLRTWLFFPRPHAAFVCPSHISSVPKFPSHHLTGSSQSNDWSNK